MRTKIDFHSYYITTSTWEPLLFYKILLQFLSCDMVLRGGTLPTPEYAIVANNTNSVRMSKRSEYKLKNIQL